MRYVIDHDFHLHSILSPCVPDQSLTPERILEYAEEYKLKTIVLTDHFWDSKAEGNPLEYMKEENLEHISQALPLPQKNGIRYLFGCEVDLDSDMNIGIHKSNYDKFDFIIIATTHFRAWVKEEVSTEERARLYVERFDKVLNSDLPFHKVGIAHLTIDMIDLSTPTAHLDLLDKISDETFERLFRRTAELGMGVEINYILPYEKQEDLERCLRPYRIAKRCGCKFYIATDAHLVSEFSLVQNRAQEIIDALNLEESDKFVL